MEAPTQQDPIAATRLASSIGIEIPAGTRSVRVEAAAQALGISPAFAWRLVASGELGSFKVGRRRLVPVAAIDAYVAAMMLDAS